MIFISCPMCCVTVTFNLNQYIYITINIPNYNMNMVSPRLVMAFMVIFYPEQTNITWL